MKAAKGSMSILALWGGLALVALVGTAPAARAAISMGPAVTYPAGQTWGESRNAAVGDFDGDGALDLAVPNPGDGTVSILLGAGDGGFAPGGAYTMGPALGVSLPSFVVAADFSEDGRTDLAVSATGNATVAILLGNGDGSFRAPVACAVGNQPEGMAVGDFDRDGHLDLAVANVGPDDISILRGTGAGTFGAAVSYAAGTDPHAVAAGDFDGDGDLDLAAANSVAPGTVSILANDGAGVFGAPASVATGDYSRAVIVADLNRDGRLDLAVANQGSWNVSVLLGNGNGTFLAAASHPAIRPRAIAAGDFDGDGIPDLAVPDESNGLVTVFPGVGDGSFRTPVSFPAGPMVVDVSIADFNGDGKPDLVAAGTESEVTPPGSRGVSVLLNTTALEPTGVPVAKPAAATGFNPNAMVAGDVDRDGVPDLITANISSDTVSFLRGLGDGTFAPAADFGAGTYPYWVAADDFDGDGDLDLAVVNANWVGTVAIMRGDGDGGFAGPVPYGTGAFPVFVASADFNRDARPDLVVANAGSDDVHILIGNGDGTFTGAFTMGVGTTPYAVAVGDFDRDGRLDLAVANFYSSSVSILLGDGDGTFGPPADFYTGYNPVFVTSADLDGDGVLDLAAANYWSGNVSVLRGAGDGTFLAPVDYNVGANPTAIAVCDFFRDGKLDLAVVCESSQVSVLAGRGDGTFLPAASFAAGAQPVAVVGGDFDRDGKTDLATANWGGDSVSVLLNWKDTVTAPTTPGGIGLSGVLRDKGVPGMSYGFSTGGSTGSMGHPVEYQFDWRGDGTDLSDWGLPTRSHGWNLPGTYHVRARARCASHPEVISDWSPALVVEIYGPVINSLLIEGGAAVTSKTTVRITYSVGPGVSAVRTSVGGAWSAWRILNFAEPTDHNVYVGTVNGLVRVYAQARDDSGLISAVTMATINLDTKAPTGVVKINGGNTTVQDIGFPGATVRLQMAMFDASMDGAEVRVKQDVPFSADPEEFAPWVSYSTVQMPFLSGVGLKKVFVQFKDGAGLKSVVYSASITVSSTGTPTPPDTGVTISNLLINDGKPCASSPSVKLTYDVSQETNIQVRYLYGTAWTAWETPVVSGGRVTKSIVLSSLNGPRQVYVQLKETAGSATPDALRDPLPTTIILDTVAPGAFLQINNGTTTLRRFNTNVNYLVLTVLGTDSASGVDKIAFSQSGSPSLVPPPPGSPDWRAATATVNSFGLNTRTTGIKSVYLWVKDRAGKVSVRKVASVNVVP
jgi:hypothetical protein